jgi:uncharacterized membrane protein YkoI
MRFGRYRRLTAAAGFLAALACASAPSAAGSERKRDHEAALTALRRGEILPLAEILTKVRQHTPGELIAVELERERGVFIYEIRVLTPTGSVRKVDLNARTGAVLPREDSRR